MSEFDPGGVAARNGNYFSFPYSPEEAEVLVLPAPWDVTTSFRDGTSQGPSAILGASTQLDFTSPFRKKAWETRIATLEAPEHWLESNAFYRAKAKEVIASLESGRAAPSALVQKVNEGSARFHQELYAEVKEQLSRGKKVVTLGGDHSVSHGPIRAHGEMLGKLSVLHIDAHADLRKAYCGFPHSHASIMQLVREMPFVTSLVQVGLRDLSPEEEAPHPATFQFSDWNIRSAAAGGASWADQCRNIVERLGEKVYLSLDVDGLDPKYCPHTGTPVPGGLELWELYYLLQTVEKSGRRFVGADLVEVGSHDWDANVGARLLYQICQFLSGPRS